MVRASFSGITGALSALQANQKRLDLIGQNLSNMNTPGYTRQQLETTSLNYSYPISYYSNGSEISVGFGTHMSRVSQIRDPYLDVQYRAQMGKSSYNDSIQTALDSLSRIMDESNVDGIRTAFDNIMSTLTSMQDIPNVNEPVYESELQIRMQALTNLLNQSAKKITEAEKAEFDRLNGEGTSEQGAIQKVNDILRQIGDLNIRIKNNQTSHQPSLELMDERNVLLDELSSYLPIEVTYRKDEQHSGTYTPTGPDGKPLTDAQGKPVIRDKAFEYDKNGNIIGKKEWPDDLYVTLSYTDANGDPKELTLVDGTEGGKDQNYGQLELLGDRNKPTEVSVKITSPASDGSKDVTITALGNTLKDGSIKASLDMLGKTGTGQPDPTSGKLDDVRGYQYYMGRLDKLADAFARVFNAINNDASRGTVGGDLLGTSDKSGTFTAENISISEDWISGKSSIASGKVNHNDIILDMLEAMKSTYPSDRFKDVDLGDKSFADYMNNVAVTLASDSYANQATLKTNVTILNGVQNSRDSVSGVSLDEEAANMMAYAAAYNAASRLMTTFDEVLERLINNTGLVGR